MRNYVIKIGFSTNNAMQAANLLSEVMDALQFDVETEVRFGDYVIVPDEIVTQADLAADKAFDDEVSAIFDLGRAVNSDNQA